MCSNNLDDHFYYEIKLDECCGWVQKNIFLNECECMKVCRESKMTLMKLRFVALAMSLAAIGQQSLLHLLIIFNCRFFSYWKPSRCAKILIDNCVIVPPASSFTYTTVSHIFCFTFRGEKTFLFFASKNVFSPCKWFFYECYITIINLYQCMQNSTLDHFCKIAGNVEVIDNRVTVCRDAVKGTCLRPQCKYYHIPVVLPPAPLMAVNDSATP